MQVLNVSVGAAQPIRVGGREVLSGIGKRPVDGRVAVNRLGLACDEQADPTVHGGLSKAVYAYPAQHLAFWRTVRAQSRVAGWDDAVPPGLVGENLLLDGVAEGTLWVGDVLRLPDCVLAVSEPRHPCDKFAAAMGFPQAVRLMQQSGYCGVYLTVIETGTVAAGDRFTLVPGPREVGILELFRARHGRAAT